MILTQLSLEDALARAGDPDTSHAAAASQTPRRRGMGQWAALEALVTHGPCTDFELAEHTGLQQTSVGKRRLELVRAGLAGRTVQRRVSPSGSPAIVWAATVAGRQTFAAGKPAYQSSVRRPEPAGGTASHPHGCGTPAVPPLSQHRGH